MSRAFPAERKRLFLEKFRETAADGKDDRVAALDHSESTTDEVELWLVEDKAFRAEYDEIWKRGIWAAEDGLRIRAKAGDKTAQVAVLKKEIPEYGTQRVRHDHGGTVKIGADDVQGFGYGWLYHATTTESRAAGVGGGPLFLPESSTSQESEDQ